MLDLEEKTRNKEITKMDVIIYFSLEKQPYKTMKQLNFLWGFGMGRICESLRRLEKAKLISKTDETPARYFVKNG